MLKRIFLFSFFLSGILFQHNNSCFCQQNIDSMKVVLQNCVEDTNKVNVLNRLSWNLRSIDPLQAKNYAEDAKTLSMRIGFEKGTGNAYNNIGVIQYRRGEYVEAIKSHLQALNIREKIGDEEGLALSYINLGNVYSDQNNNKLALDNYRNAEKILVQIGNTSRLTMIYLNIGMIDISENNFDDGLKYCEKAKVAAQNQHDKTIEAEAWNNIGAIKEMQELFPEALEAYSQAYAISSSIDDKTSMVDNMSNIGNIYCRQKNYAEALQWHLRTEKIAREIGYLEGLRSLYESLAKDYQETGKFEIALNYYIHFKQLNDSLFNAENTSAINEINAKWESDRTQKELIAQREEMLASKFSESASTQRLWWIGSGIIVLLIFVSYFIYANGKIKSNEQLIFTQQEMLRNKNKIENS